MKINKKTYNLILCTVTAFTLFACQKDANHESKALDYLNEAIYKNPHGAITMIDSIINDGTYKSEYFQKRIMLLKYKAEDKCYIEHLSDSQIIALANYFNKFGNNHDLAESHYYAGSTYRDMKEYSNALKYYNSAYKLLQGHLSTREDSILKAMILSQYSDIHHHMYLHKKAYQYIKESFMIQEELGIDDIPAYLDIARMAEAAGQEGDAASYYSKAIDKIKNAPNMETFIGYLAEPFGYFAQKGASHEVECVKHIIDSLEASGVSLPSNVIASRGHYESYYRKNARASVKYYKEALELSNNIFSAKALTKRLYDIYLILNDTTEIPSYALRLVTLEDSIKKETKPNEARDTILQLSELEKEQVRKDQNNSHTYTTAITLILVGLAAALGYVIFLALKIQAVSSTIKSYDDNQKTTHTSKEYIKQVTNINGTLAKSSNEETTSHGNNSVRLPDEQIDKQQKLNTRILRYRHIIENPNFKPHTEQAAMLINSINDTVHEYYPEFTNHIYRQHQMNKELLAIICIAKLGFSQSDTVKILGLSPATISRRWRTIEMSTGIPMKDITYWPESYH